MTDPTVTAWKMLAAVALAELLAMTLWFSATAVTPLLVAEFQLTGTPVGWLTMAVQIGFVAGTLGSAVGNLSDVVNARVLLFSGTVLGAAANAATLTATSSEGLIAWRVLTGIALAFVYPPGMKIAAGWFHDRRGLALGIVIGALTLGKAVPYLVHSLFGDRWREPMLLASVLAVIGGTVVLVTVRDGPHLAATSRFDPRAVRRIFATRGARLATFGYLGHMWELYAMWTWIAVIATASFTAAGLADASRTGALAAFVAIGSGAVGCIAAGWLADRHGRARVASAAMWTSAACAAASCVVFGASPLWFFALAVVWGAAVVADSAQFSALVSEHAPREHVGTALTLQTCLGFLLTMVTIDLLPRVAGMVGWRYASLLLVPGPLLGIVAMRGLYGSPTYARR